MSARSWVVLAEFALCVTATAQVTQRVSVSSSGVQGNVYSGANGASISADGRYVVFASQATDLVAGDTNQVGDIFLRDRFAGTTVLVSIGADGSPADGDSRNPVITPDGRFVAFESDATNLVSGPLVNFFTAVFVRDLQGGTTRLASFTSSGQIPNGDSEAAQISADGRYVAFASYAYNIVPGDTNTLGDAFESDLVAGTVVRVDVDSFGNQANGQCGIPAMSADGRFVAFASAASNLVPGDTNQDSDVFVHDLLTGQTEIASVQTGGGLSSGDCLYVSISSDGRYVAFGSDASDLVPGDTNGQWDVFVHDRVNKTTERVSVASDGTEANGSMGFTAISDDGRYVAFGDFATNLVPTPLHADWNIYVHDRTNGTTELESASSAGVAANGNSGLYALCLSGDGRYVGFASDGSNLAFGDTNATTDVFVRDRTGGTAVTSLCEPGVAGVIACPCANPPGGPGRGCDNSAATRGAMLAATGGAYLSSDSLMFSTDSEKPTATSVVLQGTAVASNGVVYGQGVRCVGGVLKRLFTKTATGGRIHAPNFAGGDPSVSARSAAKGNPIAAGESRWYLVFYRDPIVLGGCPAGSAFNTTQTLQIDWSP
jgi:Tol biopolymer transport system component